MLRLAILAACLLLRVSAFPNFGAGAFDQEPKPTEPSIQEDVTPAIDNNPFARWMPSWQHETVKRLPECSGQYLVEKCRDLAELPVPLNCHATRFGRTRDCPAVSCRQIYELNHHLQVEDGVYFLHVQDKREREIIFPVFCLMSEGGFTMVTKIPSFSNISHASDFWMHEREMNEGHRDLLQLALPENEGILPYMNRLVRHWGTGEKWQQAKVALIKNGRIVQHLHFDISGAERRHWFSKDRMTFSSWKDLTKQASTTWFSMAGPVDRGLDRAFVVSNDFFGHCRGGYVETGWMMGVGDRSLCTWERPAGSHGLVWLYSTVDTKTKFNDLGDTMDVADSFAVFLR